MGLADGTAWENDPSCNPDAVNSTRTGAPPPITRDNIPEDLIKKIKTEALDDLYFSIGPMAVYFKQKGNPVAVMKSLNAFREIIREEINRLGKDDE